MHGKNCLSVVAYGKCKARRMRRRKIWDAKDCASANIWFDKLLKNDKLGVFKKNHFPGFISSFASCASSLT